MNYIIFDLEFNQKHPDNKDIATPKLTFEILQIGAIKLDKNFNTIGEFNGLVKPTVYSTIHPYVEKLTDITIDKVNSCNKFPQVFNDFLDFIGDENYTFVVWGSGDLRELYRNIVFHNIPKENFNFKYIDIQSYASTYFKYKKGNRIGLKTAIDMLEIKSLKTFHNALNDAFYTAEIFKVLYNDKIKVKAYKVSPERKRLKPKSKVDTSALFYQFEKILKKKLTPEEKELIKLAYIMGKTHQFIKKN
ncbi:Inhibitor of the KinA pathway to sporulation, predicted exonuclease [Clostridium sp. DSM 8431]|uniref:3'-5' exonuclease n=1 Tax=Clostridium sp. DSM 8431 TaxID=1761781 RepID=UPI0008E221F8|nr:3'-5' exonuclease [Clostridium sp. DSM 8431]SFU68687.1 Inhibitor of the KinA pathway to sporulation, predicted exonuclease [Clostridium sp. DSM 8431]